MHVWRPEGWIALRLSINRCPPHVGAAEVPSGPEQGLTEVPVSYDLKKTFNAFQRSILLDSGSYQPQRTTRAPPTDFLQRGPCMLFLCQPVLYRAGSGRLRLAEVCVFANHARISGATRSKVRIRSVAPPLGRGCIQFSSDRFVQSCLTLRVSVCDGHRYIDTRRVGQCSQVNLDQGGLHELVRLSVSKSRLAPNNLLRSTLKE